MTFTHTMISQIRENRWFADKEAGIGRISAEEIFDFDSEIRIVIAKFHLKRNSETIIKRYFIPMQIASSEIGDTEHSPAFQQTLFRHYRNSSIIPGSNGGVLRFHPLIPDIFRFPPDTSQALIMPYPSSNILTIASTDNRNIISKTYKDMRGDCGQKDRIWVPNPEAEKYEALASAAYPNIPKIYGVAYYQPAFGKPTPFNILMEALQCRYRLGEVFSRSLSDSENISDFVGETAKTIARMHAAFLNCGKPDFQAIPATDDDLLRWHERMNRNFHQALSALKQRPYEAVSADMILKLESCNIRPLSVGSVMKAQIHGDLHADQGLVADRICWLDFEGQPAKEPVSPDQDFRENLLTDLAGMIQAFWYMAHVKMYEIAGLNYRKPEDHEKQRQASLAFAGIYESSEIDKKTISCLKLWVNNMTTAFTEGYFDEAEALNIYSSILKNQDRASARSLIDYWVADRAIHELRYETYGRNWGWEAIPASRLIR